MAWGMTAADVAALSSEERQQAEAMAAEATPAQEEEGPKPVLVRMADVEPQEVDWLWNPYIAKGKLTILEGDPAMGKTWLALTLAAIVSRGDPFPGPDGVPRDRREPANVVYLTAEDGLADTLRPRLDKAGADVRRVFALTGQTDGGEETGVTLSDLPVLESTLRFVRPALVVVDPLQAYLGAGVDLHRANEVRPVLAGLANLAEKHGAAVLLIRHLGKANQDRALYRGLGSIDISAAARSVLLAGKDPGDESQRVLAHTKSSLAPNGPSLAYKLGEDGFTWCGVSNVTPEALLAPPRSEEERSAVDEAADFLREALAEGPRPAKEVLREAEALGINEKSVRRAMGAGKVRIARRRIGGAQRGAGFWEWSLQDGQGVHLKDGPLSTSAVHLKKSPESGSEKAFLKDGQGEQLSILKEAAPGAGLSHVFKMDKPVSIGEDDQGGQVGRLNADLADIPDIDPEEGGANA